VNGPRLLPAAALVAAARGIPLVFHSHHRLVQPIAVRLAGEALRWSRASLVACCHFAAEPLRPYVEEDRSRVVYNGVSKPIWAAPEGKCSGILEHRRHRRIEREKGQLKFIEAARALLADFPKCRSR